MRCCIAALFMVLCLPVQSGESASWSGIDVSSRSTRCDSRTVAATQSPDRLQLSLIFPKELARRDGTSSGKDAGRCTIDLVFERPLATRTVVRLDMRAAFAKSRNAYANLQVGLPGGVHRYELKPQQVCEGDTASPLLFRYIVVAPRGAKSVRMNLDAMVKAPSGESVLVSIDSLDAIITDE
ncbi:hypothetical protein [Caballeronia sp. GaOx3]|uniref:hypothetical protein n=1 Tax=Caballeronia sp. GaOx3 TaxID=2921740 RepID=UPI0020277D79|nr:hypothetical protein [Caballeronia sp. GaOx3]